MRMLREHEIDDRWVVSLDDPGRLPSRNGTLAGLKTGIHQQMIRGDYETRDPIPVMVEARLHAELPAALEWADVIFDLRLRQRRLHAKSAARRRWGTEQRCTKCWST